MDAESQFRDAISRTGLSAPGVILSDGKLHRFPSNGKRGDLAGWYVLHGDGIPSGAFGCWRQGLTEIWRADVGRELTQTERDEQRRRVDEARKVRDQVEAAQEAGARNRTAEPVNVASHGRRVPRGECPSAP